jgi:hypothetical protein
MLNSRRRILDSFSYAPTALCASVREFPRRMWFFKPTATRRSIHEMVLHLADSEAVDYIFCRQVIATGCASGTPNVEPWMDKLGYFHQGTREALKIIHSLRNATSKLLHTVPEVCWAIVAIHPIYGELTFEDWLGRQERHIPDHIQQMRENYAIWSRQNPPRKRAMDPSDLQINNAERTTAGVSRSNHSGGVAVAGAPSKVSQFFC